MRRVVRFREQVQNIGESGRLTDRTAMQRALAALLEQVDTMLDTNVLVRQTLEDVRLTALQLLKDLEEF